MTDKILVGTGIINWPSFERVIDRYGSVNLWANGELLKMPQDLTGRYGQLVAEIKEVRESGHIGDFFRGLSASKPNVGDVLILGEGIVFYDEYETIGLTPSDGRVFDWLDSKVLYQLHSQTVDLYFVQND